MTTSIGVGPMLGAPGPDGSFAWRWRIAHAPRPDLQGEAVRVSGGSRPGIIFFNNEETENGAALGRAQRGEGALDN